MQFPAARDLETHVFGQLFYDQRDIRQGFPMQTLGKMARCHEGSFLARKGRIIGKDVHRNRWRINGNQRARAGVIRDRIGVADCDGVHPGNDNDLAHAGMGCGYFAVALESIHLGNGGRDKRPCLVGYNNSLANIERA